MISVPFKKCGATVGFGSSRNVFVALGKKDKEKAGGDRIRQTISLVEGIEQDFAKKITSKIKSSKMKVQAKINGNELRIDGKKRDDLQSAMQLIEDLQVGIPVQFINFRD